MSSSKKTMRIAKWLMDHNQVTAYLFQQNAAGVSTNDLPELVSTFARKTSDDAPIFTSHTCRLLLHRQRPFNHPDIYSSVNKQDEELVQLRFKKNVKGRKQPKRVTFREKLDAANEVFEARARYEKALHKAQSLGMDENSIEALADIVYEECGGEKS